MLDPMIDALWLALLVAVAIGMLVLATRIEPHWASKDGRTFTCRIQELATDGRSGGRWMDAKATVVDGRISLARRGLLRARRDPEPPLPVLSRAPGGQTRFAVFLLEGSQQMVALRVPARSKAATTLDGLVS